jgi:hypothetical protein
MRKTNAAGIKRKLTCHKEKIILSEEIYSFVNKMM